MILAGPISWSRLVWERLVALVVGVFVVTVVAPGGLAIAGTAVGGTFDVAGLGRIAVECVLLGAALGAVAAILVAWLRRIAAMRVLAGRAARRGDLRMHGQSRLTIGLVCDFGEDPASDQGVVPSSAGEYGSRMG